MTNRPVSTVATDIDRTSADHSIRSSWKISPRLLLSIYAVIPAAWAVVLIDLTSLQGNLKQLLPESPQELNWFMVFFVLPHILASQFSFYDREYVSAYRRQLAYGLPGVIAMVFLLYSLDEHSRRLIYAAVTMWHLIAQQVGIARVLAGEIGEAFVWWKWFTIALFAIGVTDVAGPWLNWVGAPLLIITTFLTIRAAAQARRRIGRYYLWATHGMAVSAAVFVAGGYPFFSILVPRVVHDITAWVFYLTHDHNRNLDKVRNTFYRLFAFSHLPVVVIVLALAIGLNVLSGQYLGSLFLPAILTFALFHYYSESFMWKRDSIHRRYISFNP